jgi:hypothetical protein
MRFRATPPNTSLSDATRPLERSIQIGPVYEWWPSNAMPLSEAGFARRRWRVRNLPVDVREMPLWEQYLRATYGEPLLAFHSYDRALGMAHKKADEAQSAKLSNATEYLIRHLPARRAEFKSLLPADLAGTYSLCYWDDAGCYWCTDDGRNWYVVKCIT